MPSTPTSWPFRPDTSADRRSESPDSSALPPALPYRARPAQEPALERAAVSRERGDAHKGRHFFPRQRPQFRQVGKERRDEYRAYARHTPQDLLFLAPHRTLAHGHG